MLSKNWRRTINIFQTEFCPQQFQDVIKLLTGFNTPHKTVNYNWQHRDQGMHHEIKRGHYTEAERNDLWPIRDGVNDF